MGSLLLALDIGTSSMKAGLFDDEERLLETRTVDYALDTGGPSVGIDPETIWEAFLAVTRGLGEDAARVECVVPCALSPSLVLMDREGRALHPAILHWDRRSVREAREALAAIGREEFLARAGNIPYPGSISLSSLLWLRRHEQDAFRGCCMAGHMNTFFLRRLTGRWAFDPTNASLTGLYDTVGRSGWLPDFCRELGIPRGILPPVVECDERVGTVTAAAARESGLTAGTPVIMGSNDTSAACLGAGVTEPGQVLDIAGSAELLAVCLDRPAPHAKHHLRVHPVPGRWIAFTIIVSGFALEWFRTRFCGGMDGESFYGPYLDGLLAAGAGRTPVRFVPHMLGDRTSFSDRRASFTGLTLSTTREDLALAIIESATGRLQADLRRLGRVVELSKVIRLTGRRAGAALSAYKERRLRGFRFESRESCALLGCAVLSRKLRGRGAAGT
jgi:sugar (pentulose or hexulose) kinase